MLMYPKLQCEDDDYGKAVMWGVTCSVNQPMSQSCGPHYQKAEAWKGESHSELCECQWMLMEVWKKRTIVSRK